MAIKVHHTFPTDPKGLVATDLSSRSQVATRARRRAAGCVALAVCVALALVLRSGWRDRQGPQAAAPTASTALSGSAEVNEPVQPVETITPSSEPAAAPTPSPVVTASASDELQAVEYCPGALPPSGSPCAAAEGEAFICSYSQSQGGGEQVTCRCQAEGDVPAAWICVAASALPAQAKCPVDRPSTGMPCSPAGIGCVYEPGLEGTGCLCQPGEAGPAWECMSYLKYIGH
jgi:hypothetical protein